MLSIKDKVKIEMIKHGTSGAQIAREYGVTRWAVHNVITGRRKSPKLRAFIARKIGMLPEKIWPKGN